METQTFQLLFFIDKLESSLMKCIKMNLTNITIKKKNTHVECSKQSVLYVTICINFAIPEGEIWE